MLHRAAAFVRSGSQKHHAPQRETRKTRTLLYLALRFFVSFRLQRWSKTNPNIPSILRSAPQCIAKLPSAPQCASRRRSLHHRGVTRGHQLCGVVSHPKERPMTPRESPATVLNRNVYICKPEPTCVSWRQHLPAVLTCAFKRQRRLHLQARAGSCWNPNTCADSRNQASTSASICQHLQAKAGICLHLKTARFVSPEGAPCR
jgi:hypothetical protein